MDKWPTALEIAQTVEVGQCLLIVHDASGPLFFTYEGIVIPSHDDYNHSLKSHLSKSAGSNIMPHGRQLQPRPLNRSDDSIAHLHYTHDFPHIVYTHNVHSLRNTESNSSSSAFHSL